MYNQLISKKSKLAVVGLGYVGLPLAVEFSRSVSVIGYDIDESLVKSLSEGVDPRKEVPSDSFSGTDISFTSVKEDLKEASVFIITVPSPIDKNKRPDLRPIIEATRTVASFLKKGDYVIYESTLYPGCTQEELVPVLEEVSGMKSRRDFKVGYAPERINIGDIRNSLKNNVKVVSACDNESMDEITKLYGLVVEAGIHQAPTMRIAEAAKVLENTQIDVNIALMNEFAIVFNRMGVNTQDVIKAAATKSDFMYCTPGLVGGLCIARDPYYMVHKANEMNYHSHLIHAGRFINDSMGEYVAKQTVKKLLSHDLPLLRARILVMGVTYKENVSDFRNSRVINIVRELASYRVSVDVVDPYANSEALDEEYGIQLAPKPMGKYHAVLVAVPHRDYMSMTEEDFLEMLDPNGLLVDIKGVFRDRIHQLRYWSL